MNPSVFLRTFVVQSSRCRRTICIPAIATACRGTGTRTRECGNPLLQPHHLALRHTKVPYRAQKSLLSTNAPRKTEVQELMGHASSSYSTAMKGVFLSERVLDDIEFHKLSDKTLNELADYFEDLGDSGLCSSDFDVALADGVLTINVGDGQGTYVINKQSPNRQIWFSSPRSGPKRFDVIDGRWRYSHDGVALHDLLKEEFSQILQVELDLSQLGHSHLVSDAGNWAT